MAASTPSTADKRGAFHLLHDSGCFLIHNPWDLGSARYLQGAGLAWSLGRTDNGLSRDQILAHLQDMTAGTELPLIADFESGFGSSPADVAEGVGLAVEAGVAGLFIEDATGDVAQPLFPSDAAVERLREARRTIDRFGGDTILVGRAEYFMVSRPVP